MRALLGLGIGGLLLAAGAAWAQFAISAHSGMIHDMEGQVYLGDQLVQSKFGSFPEVKENQQLRTGEGRAEVLLTPGVFLRLGENSSIRMVTNRLIDTRLEFLTGSAVVEAEDIPRDNSVTVVFHDASVHVARKGLYRFDSSRGTLRVFDGLAEVTAADKTLEVKEGHQIELDTLAIAKFDKEATDALDRWSARRSEYLAMASVQPAETLRNADSWNALGIDMSMLSDGWYYNPMFGMYTFVPSLYGDWYSPYGFRFWDPWDVGFAFLPGFYYPAGYFYSPYNIGGGTILPTIASNGAHWTSPGHTPPHYSTMQAGSYAHSSGAFLRGDSGGFSHASFGNGSGGGFSGAAHSSGGSAGAGGGGHK